jgi:isopenicillin N synthase-like dioxygenase
MRSLGNRRARRPRDFARAAGELLRAFLRHAGTTLRLLRYPPHPQAALANQLGAGAHTDWGGITCSRRMASAGLEVRNVNDGVESRRRRYPGTFVVNLGDLMQRWTNGCNRSNMHRVQNNSSSRDRYSIAFFYSPRGDSRIECLPTCRMRRIRLEVSAVHRGAAHR